MNTSIQNCRQSDRPRATAIDVHVGGRIRAARLLRGLSQSKLALKAGVSFQQVQKYERGANRIGAGRLAEMAEALDVPVTFFFDDFDDTPRRAELPQSDRQCLELFKKFNELQRPTRKAVLVLVTSLRNVEALPALTPRSAISNQGSEERINARKA